MFLKTGTRGTAVILWGEVFPAAPHGPIGLTILGLVNYTLLFSSFLNESIVPVREVTGT